MMQLDQATANIRPRHPWEGVDLGFALARQWSLPLWLLWLAVAGPVFVVANIVFFNSVWLVMLVLFWLKPVYEIALLYWLSRALFGDQPNYREALKSIGSQGAGMLAAAVSVRRLSWYRSFLLPVYMLESLPRASRDRRLREMRSGLQTPAWLTFICIHLEAVLYYSALALVTMLLPEPLVELSFEQMALGETMTARWLMVAAYGLSISVIAPFYVAAGFGLYLARRTELEAWDLEIEFRRLCDKKTSTARGPATAVMILFGLLMMAPMDQSEAQTVSRAQAHELAEEVLQREEFGRVETVKVWRYIGERSENAADEGRWIVDLFGWLDAVIPPLATILEGGLWALVGILIVMILLRFRKAQLPAVRRRQSSQSRMNGELCYQEDSGAIGESEPGAVSARVRELFAAGQIRAGVALLYRASVDLLATRGGIEIPLSATEVECARLISDCVDADKARFFKGLSRLWVALAYANRDPDNTELQQMLDQFESIGERQAHHAG